MDIKEIVSESVDWIHLTHGRDQWEDFVNTVMNRTFVLHKKAGSFLNS
jgi:hypothetical protein